MSNFFYREESSFLSGPRARLLELKYTLGVIVQFIKGFRTLHFIGPSITVFGSARFSEEHRYYELARRVSSRLSDLGFTIVTGGGPGIMEAANRGARDAGGLSVGCNIVLPMEQHHNSYLDVFLDINYFFVRKELLRKYSFAFIVMPGGFGTLDEFFETLTLIQTKMTENFPIVIMGLDYHQQLIGHINNMFYNNAISKDDMKLILFTDDVDEVVIHIEKYARNRLKRIYKPNWFLGEKQIKSKL